MRSRRWGVVAAALLPALAFAQERDESAMFGAEGDETSAADAGTSVVPTQDALAKPENEPSRDDAQLSGPAGQNQFETGEQAVDPLQVGGTLYMRYQANFQTDSNFEDSAFSAPSLLDVYLDARPSDRVRAFALGRMRYDPTIPATGTPSLIPGFPATVGSNPSVALDQLWLRFDLARTVYFTIGRQKVKWGTGRLFNPTDFLNEVKRDPLAPFDLRLGINAIKVHFPIESLGWNFYGFGLLDNNGPANTFGRLGGALRAEILVGPAEVSFSGAWVLGRRPRYAIDASTPLGPIDLYAEVAFRSGKDFTQFRERTADDPPLDMGGEFFPSYRFDGFQIPVTGGIAYTLQYSDSANVVMGVEYFYNPTGANKAVLHIPALLTGKFTPFYAGVHYVGAFALAPGLPGLPWISLSLNNIVNVSDPSGVLRFDAFFRVMSFLSIETFVSFNYGQGEFRLGGSIDLPPPTGTITVPLPTASTGVGLRVSI